MTNDLNTIPASVRYSIGERAIADCFPNSDYGTGIYHLDYGNLQALVHTVVEIIERQPNIVIVDLDDEKLVERVARIYRHFYERYQGGFDYHSNNQEASHNCMVAALAALKEK
jgi:hypothetical protein